MEITKLENLQTLAKRNLLKLILGKTNQSKRKLNVKLIKVSINHKKQISENRAYPSRRKVSITRCAPGRRSVIVLLIARSSPITSKISSYVPNINRYMRKQTQKKKKSELIPGSCFPVFASSSICSYGRKRKCSVGIILVVVANF